MSDLPLTMMRGCALIALCALWHGAAARSVAADGCPLFHCTAAATGIVSQPLIPAVLASNANSSLGTLVRQGCTGNGTILSCLYSTDKARGIARGTLKQLNATTLQPVWGSTGARQSYELDAASAADGQAPVNFSDGTVAAGDANYEVLYNASGRALGKVALDGVGKNLGLTPLSSNFGVVSQSDGFLTLINLNTWAAVGTLTLTDPTNASPVVLGSVAVGASNVLYSIGYDSANNVGVLYSIGLTVRTQVLAVRSTFTFTGSSGACPVVVSPSQSGLPGNLVLLASPGLAGDALPQNRLIALTDSAVLAESWSIPLSFGLTVSPTIDAGSQSLFYQDANGPNVYQASLIDGAPMQTFNLQSLGAFAGTFVLNGHLGASQAGSVFTLLLAGESTTTQPSYAEYVIAFQPIAMPNVLVWAEQIASASVKYTEGWNLAPASEAQTGCPIAITTTGIASSIVRLCDH
jgi:hypothetical protein